MAGIIIVAYTPQSGPPARQYVLVADNDGIAGVTVWGDTVNQLQATPDLIGRAVAFPGCSLSLYNGKRSLNVPRNATVQFPTAAPALLWWAGKLEDPLMTIEKFMQLPEFTIANILAVCATITREEKTQGMMHVGYITLVFSTLDWQPMAR